MSQEHKPWQYRGYLIFPNGSSNKWSVVRESDQQELERLPTKQLVRRSIDRRMGK